MKWFALSLLLFSIGLVWMMARGFSPSPSNYSGDSLMVLAQVKVAQEGDMPLFGHVTPHRLGAPYQANWDGYPIYERPTVWLTGRLAGLVGVGQAVNIMALVSHLSAGLSMFLVLMNLGTRLEWAFLSAFAFACSVYQFDRSNTGHLWLAFTWIIPLALWSLITERWCVPVGLLLGLGNPYNVFFFGIVAAVTAIARKRFAAPWAITGWAGVGFVLQFYPTIAQIGNPYLHLIRDLPQQERGALRLIDLITPTWCGWFAKIKGATSLPGEVAYIGLLGLAGVVVALWRRSIHSAWILSLLIACGVGGLAEMLFVTTGFGWFRSANRCSVWILAIALMVLPKALTRFKGWAMPLLVVLSGADAYPTKKPDPSATIEADRANVESIERELPKGAQVYCWPPIPFPEGGYRGIDEYSHFRLFIWSHDLRLSFGNVTDLARDAWQFQPTVQPKERGFDAVYLNTGTNQIFRKL